MRFRDSSTVNNPGNVQTYIPITNEVPGPTQYGSGISTGEYKYISDVVTPNWYKRRGKTPLVFNPYSSGRFSVYGSGGGLGYRRTDKSGTPPKTPFEMVGGGDWLSPALKSIYQTDWLLPSLSVIDEETKQSIIDSAITECNAKVRSGSTLGEGLGQWRQTLQLLTNPLAPLRTILNGANRSNANVLRWFQRSFYGPSAKRAEALQSALNPRNFFRNFKGSLVEGLIDGASSGYLMYRYGILPLMSDIRGVIKALQAPKGFKRVTARGAASKVETLRDEIIYNVGSATCKIQVQTVHTYSVRAMRVDEYTVSLQSGLGLLPDQIPFTLWNLTYLSFVADWFVNIGDYINASVPRFGLTALGGCYVERESIVTQWVVTDCYINPSDPNASKLVLTVPMTGSYVKHTVRTRRCPYLTSSELIVNPDFKLKQFTRMADAAALAYQTIGKLLLRRS